MREEYNKFCEKLRTIIRTEKEKYKKTKNCANDQRKEFVVTISITFLVFSLTIFIIFIFATQNLTSKLTNYLTLIFFLINSSNKGISRFRLCFEFCYKSISFFKLRLSPANHQQEQIEKILKFSILYLTQIREQSKLKAIHGAIYIKWSCLNKNGVIPALGYFVA